MQIQEQRLEKLREIKRRGLQDKLPPEKRRIFDEIDRRGLLESEGRPKPLQPIEQPRPEQPVERPNQAYNQFAQEPWYARAAGAVEGMASLVTNTGADIAQNALELVNATPLGSGSRDLYKMRTGQQLTDEQAARVPEEMVSWMRYEPRTTAGQKLQEAALQEMGEAVQGTFLEDIDDTIQSFKKGIAEETGSQVYAEAALAVPMLVLELLPMGRTPKKFVPEKATTQADVRKQFVETPLEVNQIRQVRNEMYSELNRRGNKMRGGSILEMVDAMENALTREGIDLDLTGMRTKLEAARKRNAKVKTKRNGMIMTQTEPLQRIEDLKQMMFQDYKGLDGRSKYAVDTAFRSMEEFADENLGRLLTQPNPDAKKAINTARDLGGRVRRAEAMEEIVNSMDLRSTDMGSPLDYMKTKLRGILENKNQRRYYSDSELQLMRDIVKGGVGAETGILKMLGRAGLSPVTLTMGAARALYVLGDEKWRRMRPVSKGRAIGRALGREKKRVSEGFDALRTMVLAGESGEEAVRRYLRAVPKGKRDARELGEILADPKYNLDEIESQGRKLQREAAEIARGIRIRNTAIMNATIQNEGDDEPLQ